MPYNTRTIYHTVLYTILYYIPYCTIYHTVLYTILYYILVPAAIRQTRREGKCRSEHKSVKSWRKVEREISKWLILIVELKHLVYRLKELLRGRLRECGWRDQLKDHCRGTCVTLITITCVYCFYISFYFYYAVIYFIYSGKNVCVCVSVYFWQVSSLRRASVMSL